MKLRPISRRAQTQAVPRTAPYPSGQGSFAPLESTGQVPFAYHCAKAPLATGMVANEVPTTLQSGRIQKGMPNKTRAKIVWSLVEMEAGNLN